MKKIVLASLMMVCLPYWAMSQSVDDDLYFIPKKKAEKKEEVKQEVKVVVPQKQNTTTVYAAPGSTVVVKDVKGKVRDVDEYNRRYTSRDNNFSMENDTLYIEEKPLNERGEWVNGFEGSQDDYEYAMRIVRFRNPRYAIPVSSPLYWDVVYGLPSWDWNVYDDGLYAYVFPTYTNRLWWDWRWNYPYGASWGFSWGWSSPWYYNSWYYPGYWGGGYWGGYWGYHHHHHHHYYPHYSGHGWGGGYWGGGHGWYGSSRRNPGIHAGRYTNSYGSSRPSRNNYVNSYDRNSRNSYVGNSRQNVRNSANSYRTATRNGSSSGRVVSGSDGVNSVRPNRSAIRTRTGATLSPSQAAGVRPGNSYSRPTEGRGLPIPDQAVPGEVWEMQQDLLIREQGLQAVALIVTIVAFRTLAAVHIPVAAVLPVIVRLTLTVVVELLLPVVVFLVAVGLPVVPEAVFPVQVAVADRVPDK